MGGFQNFAISFTIISILAGCLTSYAVGFEHGGPIVGHWGWLLVGLWRRSSRSRMAEIASAYPTAGGLYYWASKLGSPGWGWATGWFNLIGQVAVTAAIGYGLATFGAGAVRLLVQLLGAHERLVRRVVECVDLHPVRALPARRRVINLFNIRITSGLNMISAWWHMVGVVVIVGVLIIVPDNHQSLSYVFTETVNNSGFGDGTTSFEPGVLVRVRARTPARAVHDHGLRRVCAHGRGDAQRVAHGATGMWTSVVVSVVFGWILLLAVTFAIPSTEGALDRHRRRSSPSPIWTESMSQNWAEALLFICVVAQFFCVTASVTSASRMMFAFSRDRAVPGHQIWRRVARNRVRGGRSSASSFFSPSS